MRPIGSGRLTNSDIAFGVERSHPGVDAPARRMVLAGAATDARRTVEAGPPRQRRLHRHDRLAGGRSRNRRAPARVARGRRREKPRPSSCAHARSGSRSCGRCTPRCSSSPGSPVLAATVLSYGIARTVTRPLGVITATMREMAATGDLTRRIPVPSAPQLGRRGCAAAGLDLQHDDRFDRPVPARSRPARAAVRARPALDRRRTRNPESADDHQGRAARAPQGRHRPDRRQDGGRRHRRRDRAAEPARHRSPRLRPADSIRSGSDGHQCPVRRRGPRQRCRRHRGRRRR